MAKNSKIEWTDHTFNPWMGCTKVSDGCKHCYAETMMDKRYGKVQWGPQGMRIRTDAKYWKQPLKWNKENWFECGCGWRGHVPGEQGAICPNCGTTEGLMPTRQRVFCGSLMDIGDHHPSVLNEWIEDLVRLIYQTRNLDWLFLTKRPAELLSRFGMFWGLEQWPENVWVGVSAEDQKTANERIPLLQRIPATVRFVSCEPLVGCIDLSEAIEPDDDAWDEVNAMQDDDEPDEFAEEAEAECDWINFGSDLVANPEHREWVYRRRLVAGFKTLKHGVIDLVIAGGESGGDARITNSTWVRSLRDECQQAGVKFFFKQWGEWAPFDQLAWATDETLLRHKPVDVHGAMMCRVGKGMAGHVLDGRVWRKMPR